MLTARIEDSVKASTRYRGTLPALLTSCKKSYQVHIQDAVLLTERLPVELLANVSSKAFECLKTGFLLREPASFCLPGLCTQLAARFCRLESNKTCPHQVIASTEREQRGAEPATKLVHDAGDSISCKISDTKLCQAQCCLMDGRLSCLHLLGCYKLCFPCCESLTRPCTGKLWTGCDAATAPEAASMISQWASAVATPARHTDNTQSRQISCNLRV